MDGWDGPQKCPLIFFIFDGWMGGWMGVAEYQKCPSNFLILCEDIRNLYAYIYIYQCSKFVTNFVMDLKI